MLINGPMYFRTFRKWVPPATIDVIIVYSSLFRDQCSTLVQARLEPATPHFTCERYTDKAQDHGMTWETEILKYSYPAVLKYNYQTHGWTSMRAHNSIKLKLYNCTSIIFWWWRPPYLKLCKIFFIAVESLKKKDIPFQ